MQPASDNEFDLQMQINEPSIQSDITSKITELLRTDKPNLGKLEVTFSEKSRKEGSILPWRTPTEQWEQWTISVEFIQENDPEQIAEHLRSLCLDIVTEVNAVIHIPNPLVSDGAGMFPYQVV